MNYNTHILQNSSFPVKFINPIKLKFLPEIICAYWLLQVPRSKLSDNAKKIYGRLIKWADDTGKAHRSINQLAKELNVSSRTIERGLKELRETQLIITYLVKPGGVNHYQFLEHEWMEEQKNRPEYFKLSTPPDTNTIHYPKTLRNKGMYPPDTVAGSKYKYNYKYNNTYVDRTRRPVDKYKFVDKDPPRSSVNRQPFFTPEKRPEKTPEQKARFEIERNNAMENIKKITSRMRVPKNVDIERNLTTNFKRSMVGYTQVEGLDENLTIVVNDALE